jgi:hypothetical protein
MANARYRLFLTLLLAVSTTAAARAEQPDCKTLNESVKSGSKLFRYVDDLAEHHVYYGSITTAKSSAISKVFLTDECRLESKTGVIIRFQVNAKEQKKTLSRLYYCYAKIVKLSRTDWRNNGTFCGLSKNDSLERQEIRFPYDSPSDPYARVQLPTGASDSDIDRLKDEYDHARASGLDSGFDPFYDTGSRNTDGPDSKNDSGL